MPRIEKHVISERALWQRINRKLETQGQRLRMRAGKFFLLDRRKGILASFKGVADLERLGRDLEVLAEFEMLRKRPTKRT